MHSILVILPTLVDDIRFRGASHSHLPLKDLSSGTYMAQSLEFYITSCSQEINQAPIANVNERWDREEAGGWYTIIPGTSVWCKAIHILQIYLSAILRRFPLSRRLLWVAKCRRGSHAKDVAGVIYDDQYLILLRSEGMTDSSYWLLRKVGLDSYYIAD
jgi:hypothetical protein